MYRCTAVPMERPRAQRGSRSSKVGLPAPRLCPLPPAPLELRVWESPKGVRPQGWGGCGGPWRAAAPPGAGPQAPSAACSLCPWLGRLTPGQPAAVLGDILWPKRRETESSWFLVQSSANLLRGLRFPLLASAALHKSASSGVRWGTGNTEARSYLRYALLWFAFPFPKFQINCQQGIESKRVLESGSHLSVGYAFVHGNRKPSSVWLKKQSHFYPGSHNDKSQGGIQAPAELQGCWRDPNASRGVPQSLAGWLL